MSVALLRRPDGSEVQWSSRRHRKGLGLRPLGVRRFGHPERLWGGRPRSSSVWMGLLFGIGSTCFAFASLPVWFDNVSATLTAWTFFAGSVFFTSAAYLQFHEVLAAPDAVGVDAPRKGVLRAALGWKPHRIDWWASSIQLVGTVFFNVSTFAATRSDLDLSRERALIWAPDVLGSICFLVASWLAWSEVNPGWRPRSDHSTGWRIAAVNLAGSVAFGVAAIAARYLTTTGDVANVTLVNSATFVGAVLFLVGAALLPVESARDTAADDGSDTASARDTAADDRDGTASARDTATDDGSDTAPAPAGDRRPATGRSA